MKTEHFYCIVPITWYIACNAINLSKKLLRVEWGSYMKESNCFTQLRWVDDFIFRITVTPCHCQKPRKLYNIPTYQSIWNLKCKIEGNMLLFRISHVYTIMNCVIFDINLIQLYTKKHLWFLWCQVTWKKINIAKTIC